MDRSNPKPGQIYRHFKGGLYVVDGIATHTETSETLVIYSPWPLKAGCTHKYARPLRNFMERLDSPKMYRFTLKEDYN